MSRRRVVSRRRSDRGAVFVMVAGALTVLILLAGLAIDLGQQRFARRDAQANADVIALDMARVADGRPLTEISAIPGANFGPDQLAKSLERNGFAGFEAKRGVRTGLAEATADDGTHVVVEWGYLSESPDPAVTCGSNQLVEVRSGGPWWLSCSQGQFVPNAAKVTVSDDVDFLFLPAGGGPDGGSVTRTAYARYGGIPTAAFQVGSFGVSVLDDGFLNNLLTAAIGAPVALDVLHYEGLANANITIDELLGLIDIPDADVPLSTLTPQEALDTTIALGDIWIATVQALVNRDDTVNAGVLQGLIDLGVPSAEVTLSDLLDVDSPGEDSGLRAGLDVLDILGATAFISQCPDGVTYDEPSADPTECSAINVPAVNVGLPGLADVGASLQVIQGPIVVSGPVGASGRTGQVRLGLGGDLGTTQMPCSPALAALCIGSVIPIEVSLDASVGVAGGPNTITDILCNQPSSRRLTVNSITELLDIDLSLGLRIGVLLSVPLLGEVHVVDIVIDISGGNLEEPGGGFVNFDVPPDELGVTERGTGLGDIGLSGLDLDVDIDTVILNNVLGLSTLLNVLLGFITDGILEALVLSTVVNPLLSTLDNLLLGPLLDMLGVNVVGSDLVPLAIDCNAAGIQLVG